LGKSVLTIDFDGGECGLTKTQPQRTAHFVASL